jgi:hypothetical protein
MVEPRSLGRRSGGYESCMPTDSLILPLATGSLALLGAIAANWARIIVITTTRRATLRLIGTIGALLVSFLTITAAASTTPQTVQDLVVMWQILAVTQGVFTVTMPYFAESFTWLAEQSSDEAVTRLLLVVMLAVLLVTLTYLGIETTWWAPVALLSVGIAGTSLQMRYGSPMDRLTDRWFPPRAPVAQETAAKQSQAD